MDGQRESCSQRGEWGGGGEVARERGDVDWLVGGKKVGRRVGR